MKLVPIPEDTLHLNRRMENHMDKTGENVPWWRIEHDSLPSQAILAVSTGGGQIKPGLTVYLIGGHDRKVWPDGAPVKGLSIHEYVGLVENTGWQTLVQLGRDVKMVERGE